MGHGSESPAVQVAEGLRRGFLEKEIPCSLLYDARGSALYEQITALEEYYPFRAEEQRLQKYAREICEAVSEESVIVELGCGTARKSAIVLSAVQRLRGRCRYVGIDVSSSFLQEARANLEAEGIAPEAIEMVEGEYMQGLKEVRARHPDENLCIMWLGSSVGNFTDDGAIQFVRDTHAAVGTRSQIFLCADMWKDKSTLHAAYHDKKGVTELFIKNGMRVALNLLGHATTAAEEATWRYDVVVNDELRRVEMYLTFTEEMTLPDHNIHIRSGERVLVEVSRKFTSDDFNRLANEAGFHIDVAWRDSVWGMMMLIPFQEALERCWKHTDAFFRDVPNWCVKPIDVRHPFKFYYGHIQAFAKLKLRPSEPSTATDIMFSRGIDPNVVDPTKCHSHPEVPPEWPSRAEIEAYVHKTRAKILAALAAGDISPRLAILAIEHEYMHLETLAYMRAQDRKASFEANHAFITKPHANGTTNAITNGASNGVSNGTTNGASNGVSNGTTNGISNGTTNGASNGVSNGTTNGISNGTTNGISNGTTNGISNGTTNGNSNGTTNGISNGISNGTRNGSSKAYTNGRVHNVDEEERSVKLVEIPAGKVTLGGDPRHGTFMWDNEYPPHTTTVAAPFRVACNPVTIAEFRAFIKAGGYSDAKLWKPLDFQHFQRQKITKPATWSEIDGEYYVHTSTATHHWLKLAHEPVFTSLSEAEAFCAWSRGRVMTEAEYHRVLSSKEGERVEKMRCGGWEWTSSLFEAFPGFVAMAEYPEYSSDFFDGSHYVLKGASPVTHRCMWRDSFRNFYQRQYPYVFAKFRVCQ